MPARIKERYEILELLGVGDKALDRQHERLVTLRIRTGPFNAKRDTEHRLAGDVEARAISTPGGLPGWG